MHTEKKQIVFIHGGNAFTEYADFIEFLSTKPIDDPLGEREVKRWQSTFRDDVSLTHEVYLPTMPNKQNAKYLEWKIWFERYHAFLHDGVTLIGHSLGGYFLVKYLSEEKMPVKVSSLYLLASPFENDDFGGEDGGDFAFDHADLINLSSQVPNIRILHSKDDPVVPYAHALLYKEALPSAELVSFADKNHFILPEFPELIKLLQGA